MHTSRLGSFKLRLNGQEKEGRMGLFRVGFILLGLLFLPCGGYAQDVDNPERVMPEEPIPTGFVFIDNQYVESPYEVVQREGTIFLNEHPLQLKEVQSGFEHSRRWRNHRYSPSIKIQQIKRLLESDGLLVYFSPEQSIHWFHRNSAYTILDILLHEETAEDKLERFAQEIPSLPNADSWRDIIEKFEPTRHLEQRMEEHISASRDPVEQPVNLEDPQHGAMYYFTVAGMILTVFGFGTVLQYRPPELNQWGTQNSDSGSLSLVKSCVLLLGALSIFDLVCTMVLNEMGSFWEVNPFANSLVDRSIELMAFKLVPIVMGMTFLFWARSYAAAQMASWWLCLVLTLLTARWVIVTSLLMI